MQIFHKIKNGDNNYFISLSDGAKNYPLKADGLIFVPEKKKINPSFVFFIMLFFAIFTNILFAASKTSFSELSNYTYKYAKNNYRATAAPVKKFQVNHLKTPQSVKGIYISSWTAGIKTKREEILRVIDSTEINSAIIDIKDYSGKITFKTESDYIKSLGSEENRIPDIKDFINELHKKNIYVIGRISIFQDDYLANKKPEFAIKNINGGVWEDGKNISWLDPAAKTVWEYTVIIGKEAERAGFDELNYDYIRFPSDGDMRNIVFPYYDGIIKKEDVIENFFIYLNENLKGLGIPVSANIFGFTLWKKDDLKIGQILEKAAPYFDYISPMVYPSHYPPGFNGFKNPAEHPYELIKEGMQKGVERLTSINQPRNKLRPWLQDFDTNVNYDTAMIKKEKQAVYDAGLNSWMMWNAANRYTEEAYLVF